MMDDQKGKSMMDDQNGFRMPTGEVSPHDLSTDSEGSGSSDTDTGGLDADGTELGATSPSDNQRRAVGKRTDENAARTS